MQKFFPRQLEALESIFKFTADFISQNALEASLKFAIDVTVEELFTNMIKYGTESDQDISIELNIKDNRLIIQLIDRDVEPFDITHAPEVDTQLPLEKRTPGGLGLHFVKKMMDDIRYEYEQRQSKITLIKRLH